MANIEKKARDWFKNEDSGARMPTQRGALNNKLPVSYFGPLSNFFSDMDRMFDNTFRSLGVPSLAGAQEIKMFNPNVDIASTDKEYTITCEMPGLEEKDINLNVSPDGILTISGEKRQETTDNRQDTHCTECSYGAFARTLSLPDDVDQSQIEARFKNGVLAITCPRTESAKQSRRQIHIVSNEGTRASNMNERNASSQQGPKKAA